MVRHGAAPHLTADVPTTSSSSSGFSSSAGGQGSTPGGGAAAGGSGRGVELPKNFDAATSEERIYNW